MSTTVHNKKTLLYRFCRCVLCENLPWRWGRVWHSWIWLLLCQVSWCIQLLRRNVGGLASVT